MRCLFSVLAIHVVTAVVVVLLLALLFILPIILPIIPWWLCMIMGLLLLIAQFFVARYIAPKYKNLSGIVAVVLSIFLLVMVWLYVSDYVVQHEYGFTREADWGDVYEFNHW